MSFGCSRFALGCADDFADAGLVALTGVACAGCCNAAAASMTALADVGACQSICLVGVIVVAILGKLTIAAGWVANAGKITWVAPFDCGATGVASDWTTVSLAATAAMLAGADAAELFTLDGVTVAESLVSEADDATDCDGATVILDCAGTFGTTGVSLATSDVVSLGKMTADDDDVTTEDGTTVGVVTTDDAPDALCDT